MTPMPVYSPPKMAPIAKVRMALGTIKLSPNVLGFAQIVHGRSENDFEANPVADPFRVPQGTFCRWPILGICT